MSQTATEPETKPETARVYRDSPRWADFDCWFQMPLEELNSLYVETWSKTDLFTQSDVDHISSQYDFPVVIVATISDEHEEKAQ